MRKPDYKKWMARRPWTFNQVVQLVAGEEPSPGFEEACASRASQEALAAVKVGVAAFKETRALPFRVDQQRGLTFEPIDVEHWATRTGRVIPDEMRTAIQSARTAVFSSDALSPRKEESYLNIIGAMLEAIISKGAFRTQTDLIAHLEEQNRGAQGVAKTTLETTFNNGKISLKESLARRPFNAPPAKRDE